MQEKLSSGSNVRNVSHSADSGHRSGRHSAVVLPTLPLPGPAPPGALQPDGGGDYERGGRHDRHGQGRQQGGPRERSQAQEVSWVISRLFVRSGQLVGTVINRALSFAHF